MNKELLIKNLEDLVLLNVESNPTIAGILSTLIGLINADNVDVLAVHCYNITSYYLSK